MRTGKNSLSRKLSAAFILTAALLGITVSLLFSSLREQSREVCTYKIRQAVAEIVSSETAACLRQADNGFLKTSYRPDGSPGTLTADSVTITALENNLRRSINRRLAEMGNSDIAVPLGTLTGITALTEKGPEIHMTLQRDGSAETHITSTFTSAGINQTRYSLRLTVTVTVLAQLPAYSEEITTETEQMLCEAIIVGNVPRTL